MSNQSREPLFRQLTHSHDLEGLRPERPSWCVDGDGRWWMIRLDIATSSEVLPLQPEWLASEGARVCSVALPMGPPWLRAKVE